MQVHYCDHCGQRVDPDRHHGPYRDASGRIYCKSCKPGGAVSIDGQSRRKHSTSSIRLRTVPEPAGQATDTLDSPRSKTRNPPVVSPIRILLIASMTMTICAMALFFIWRSHPRTPPSPQVRQEDAAGHPPAQGAGRNTTGQTPKSPQRDPRTHQQIPELFRTQHAQYYSSTRTPLLKARWNFGNPDQIHDFMFQCKTSDTGENMVAYALQHGILKVFPTTGRRYFWSHLIPKVTIKGPVFLRLQIESVEPLSMTGGIVLRLYWNNRSGRDRRNLAIGLTGGGIWVSKTEGELGRTKLAEIPMEGMDSLDALQANFPTDIIAVYRDLALLVTMHGNRVFDRKIPLDIQPDQVHVGITIHHAVVHLKAFTIGVDPSQYHGRPPDDRD